MAKTVGLRIEIEGLSDITKGIVGLEQEIKGLNEQLKQTEVGSDEYIKLRNRIAEAKEELKGARKEQRDFIKQANTAKFKKGSYFDLNEQLKKLRKEFKNLSATERKGAIGQKLTKQIQKLDKELKEADASIGQFQRNVGNYQKALDGLIPGFSRFSKAITNAQGKLNLFGKALVAGFVAFKAAQFVARAVKQLDEFIQKIDETKQAVAGFSGASGEELNKLTAQTTALADTFNADSEQIAKSARALADQLGIGFDEALGKIEGRLVEGVASNEEFLSSVEQYPEAFEEATGAVTDFSERNQQLLNTNKELAQSQVDVAKRLAGVTDTFKTIGATLQTVLFKVLADLIDLFRPVVAAFQRAGAAFGRLFETFKSFGKEGQKSITLTSIITSTFERLAGILQFVADAITFLVDGFNSLVENVPIVRKIVQGVIAVFQQFQKNIRELPFIFAGVIEALKQLGTNFKNFFQTLVIDSQIVAAKIKGVFGAAVKDQLEELRARRKQINEDGKTIGAAFQEGFENARLNAKKAADARLAEEEKKAALKREQERVKESAEIRAKQLKEAQDLAKKLAKAREKFAKDELNAERARAALLADLQARLIDEQIKNIEDASQRRIAEINNSFDAQIAAFEKGNAKLQQDAQAREEELIKIFGEGSKEVLQAREAFNKDLASIEAEQAKIIVELEKQRQTELAAARKESRDKEIAEAKKLADELRAFRDSALSEELAFIDAGANERALKRQQALNNELIAEENALERQKLIRLNAEQEIADNILTIRNKLQALDDQEAFLKQQAAEGVEIKQEEYNAILTARQELATQLTALELQQTELERQQAKEREDLRKRTADAQKEAAQASFEFLKGLLERRDQDEQEKLDAAAQRSQERQSQLTDEISNATGLRKKFLQQQLNQEIANEKQLEQQKEQIQKKAALRDKAVAIGQSIIQGILATQRAAAAAPGPPLNLPIVIATAIAAAARTAAIATQKFEDGGIIQGPSHSQGGVPFTVQGRAGFEAEGGEFIVNKKSTAKFLPLLQKINSVKFAEGGMIGGIPTVPNVTGISVGTADSLRAFNERTEAIRQSIMRTQVVLSTDELDEDNDNKARIQKRVRLE